MASEQTIERVSFVPGEAIAERVEAAFARIAAELAALLPEGTAIEHVGSTAVPGSLTKGDLDLQLRVAPEAFAAADALLAARYERNGIHSSTYSSFKDDALDPPLGLQLCVIDGPEDFFVAQRDFLAAHPASNAAYNDLKRRFEGAEMDAYRAEKRRFMEDLLASEAFAAWCAARR